jgi:Fe-S-cluster containining protein
MTQACSLPEIRRALLRALYEVYEELTKEYAFACSRECSACCTHNVLATTVEVDLVVDRIAQLNRPDLAARLRQGPRGRRMKPRLTINDLADHCLRREEPPEPINEFDAGPCPLRDEDGCPIYPVRPFACRSLWSSERCEADGQALPASLLVTLNGVFEQLIEDLDVGGLSGNMIDLFVSLSDPPCRAAYHSGVPLDHTDDLLANRPNSGLLVPPAHRSAVMHALQVLDKREVQGIAFRQAVKALRAGA